MKIAICDDERIYQEELLRYFQQMLSASKPECRYFISGEELLASDFEYDFLFLDIEMPGIDGIQVKNILEKTRSQARIIFTTSHQERMIEAFGEKVIGFIQKPFPKDSLVSIFEKMNTFYNRKRVEWDDGGKHYAIPADSICYIEAQDKYTCLVSDTEKYLIRRPLKEWENILPQNSFCRVNRSFLINLKLFDKMANQIVLGEGKAIRLSRKDKSAIEEKYKSYIRERAGYI
ncbi:MAG: response regulator transcription factor [Lachnospiraceae bacterium]|nr:response regulator transcription factor [Lachnospiraceae bacterium]